MVYVKLHKTGEENLHTLVVAVCDEDIIGKEFEEGDRHIVASEKFYKGEIKPDADVVEILKSATNINLLGKKSIALGIQAGVISEENIITIQGVPHAQSTSS